VALVVIVAGDPGVIPDLLARDCRGGGRLHDPAAITRDEAEAWFTRWRCRDDHAVGVGRPSGRLRRAHDRAAAGVRQPGQHPFDGDVDHLQVTPGIPTSGAHGSAAQSQAAAKLRSISARAGASVAGHNPSASPRAAAASRSSP